MWVRRRKDGRAAAGRARVGYGWPGARVVDDVSVADWVVARLVPTGRRAIVARTIVPDVFPAYARVLHPFLGPESHDGPLAVRWAQVAAWSDRRMHPEVQWERLIRPDDGLGPPPFEAEPALGPMDPDTLALLATVLQEHTRTPDLVYCAIWDGYGGLPFAIDSGWPPRVQAPDRKYVLLAATLAVLTSPTASAIASRTVQPPPLVPDLWWPADRAWYVGCDPDLSSTYVGGSPECIDALLAFPGLEVLRGRVDDRIDVDGDAVNRR